MSKYTTELRYICESLIPLDTSVGYRNVADVIDKARPKIFDFQYPIFDNDYKELLETKIIKHFYTREIGEETYGLWKLRLDTLMNEIMPYYNQLYLSEKIKINPLENYSHEKTYKKLNEGHEDNTGTVRTNVANNGDSNVLHGGEITTQNNNTNTNVYSDTPQGSLTGVNEGKYLTDARKISDNGSTKNTFDNYDRTGTSFTGNTTVDSGNSGSANSVEEYLENLSGFNGSSSSSLLLEYRKTFLNIDTMVINELEKIFIQLW